MEKLANYFVAFCVFFPTIGMTVLGMGYGMYHFFREGR